MGAVGEERHEGGSSFQSGAEGSGCGPDSRSSNPNNNVQTFVRTQSIDSMNLNNLNSIHEPAPATTSTNNGSGGSSSSANKSPSTPQAIPVSDPDAPPDPWASLQATYCMQHDRTSNDSPRRGQAIASGRHSSSSSSSSFGEGGMKSNRSKPSKMRDTGLIPVLSEDEDEDGPGVHRKHTPVVRAGQWGEGDMATAGTLMLGEDVGKIRGSHQHSSQSGAASAAHSGWAHGAQHHERGSGGGGAGVQAGVRQREEGGDDDLDIRSLAPRTHRSNGSGEGDAMARSTPPPDMSLEEIDDFDTLLDEQAAAHSYSALDAKMAAFDAMHDGDYY
ncbi:MAG: hypothetical protein WDW36_009835 [Sanguina aurantia]